MDVGKIAGKIPKWLQRYRYPILIVLVGLVLLMLPGRSATDDTETPSAEVSRTEQADPARELEEILAQISGVGKVRVMLSVGTGQITVYQQDEDSTGSDSGSSVRRETVTVTDAERNEQALITQIIPAAYQGAVVVCQGAQSASVRLAVVEAVCKATGLGANQIVVLKMK